MSDAMQDQDMVWDPERDVYILITQCLQNSFFLSKESQLCLPDDVVRQMLVGTGYDYGSPDDVFVQDKTYPARRSIQPKPLERGPLYQFFKAILSDTRPNDLHIINVKDWHYPSDEYDRERRYYGTHCEAGTWGARAIDGFEVFLEPWSQSGKAQQDHAPEQYILKTHQPARTRQGQTRIPKTYLHEIRGNTLFDFQPVLKRTVQSDSNVAYNIEQSPLTKLLDQLIGTETNWQNKRVYLVVIGVYSDIKIKTLLTGLRSRYIIHNLIVSDVLTASPTLERHLAGLDYADKVLQVEIIHNLNELADVLHLGDFQNPIDPQIIQHNPDFRDYRTYYLDKQNVLSYSDKKMEQYLSMTAERMDKIYSRSEWIASVLRWVGFAFLALSLLGIIVSVLSPDVDVIPVAVLTGGLGLVGLVSTFFVNPLKGMRDNLYSVVRLRNYLESYSTVTALLRHHLTAPEYLNDRLRGSEPDEALERISRQLKLIDQAAETMNRNYQSIAQEQVDSEEGLPPERGV